MCICWFYYMSLNIYSICGYWIYLTFRWSCIVINSYNKINWMHYFLKFIFGIKLLHVSDSSSVHHQEFFTVHTAMVYVIQVCWQLAKKIRTELRPDPLWHIPYLCVQWKTPDDGQRNCPKHVEFYSKNKFEKLVHLVSFIIRTDYIQWNLEVCHPRCVCENWKGYVDKHNCVN